MIRTWLAAIAFLFPAAPSGAVTLTTQRCPIVVQGVSSYGIEARITIQNRADFPVRDLVFHITYSDPLHTYHEQTLRSDLLIQPYQRVYVTTPPITDGIVDWATIGASVSCRPVIDQ